MKNRKTWISQNLFRFFFLSTAIFKEWRMVAKNKHIRKEHGLKLSVMDFPGNSSISAIKIVTLEIPPIHIEGEYELQKVLKIMLKFHNVKWWIWISYIHQFSNYGSTISESPFKVFPYWTKVRYQWSNRTARMTYTLKSSLSLVYTVSKSFFFAFY